MKNRDKFNVSEFNFFDQVRAPMSLPKRIWVTDESLREGEETPEVTMTLDDKVVIAKMLVEIGVTETCVGFVNYIKDHTEAQKRLEKEVPELKTWCFLRTMGRKDLKEDIKRDMDIALKLGVERPLVIIMTSDIQHKVWGVTREKILEDTRIAIEAAKSVGATVDYGPVDTTRTDLSYLKTLMTCALESGASRIHVYDSVGALNPQATFFWMSEIKKTVKGPVEYHCHNDFGLAVANTCAAVAAGAEYIDLVINGLGDRAGNANFEECVMALEGLYHVETGIKTEGLLKLSRKYEEITKVKVPRNKAIVGVNTFLHESDFHVHSVLAGMAKAFEPYEPELVGQKRALIFGSTTSSDSIKRKAENMGIKLTSAETEAVGERIKKKIDEKGFASEEEVASFIKALKK